MVDYAAVLARDGKVVVLAGGVGAVCMSSWVHMPAEQGRVVARVEWGFAGVGHCASSTEWKSSAS